jgi:hypothetical protein
MARKVVSVIQLTSVVLLKVKKDPIPWLLRTRIFAKDNL